MDKLKSIYQTRTFYFIIGVCLSGIILYFRYNEPLFNPHFYTEDSNWFAMLMQETFFAVLQHAKEQYYVLGNLLMLKSALLVNNVTYNGQLLDLPKSLYWLSLLFYSIVFNLHTLLLFENSKYYKSLLIAIALSILSLHGSDYEIFGRASNIGFAFFYIALIVITSHLTRSHISYFWKVLGDVLILLSIYTNPAVFLLLPLHALTLLKRIRNFKQNKTWLMSSLLMYICAIGQLFKMYQSTSKKLPGAYGRMIEAGGARSILFPFIEFFYNSLSDMITVILLVLFFSLIFMSILNAHELNYFSLTKNKNSVHLNLQKIVFILLYGLLSLTLISILKRPFDTILNYQSTFPDRYFYIQNMIVVFIYSYILLFFHSRLHVFMKVILYIIAFSYISSSIYFLCIFSGKSLMWSYPPMSVSLQEQISIKKRSQANIILPVYFNGWPHMSIPYKLAIKGIHFDSLKNILAIAKVNDANWTNGVLHNSATILIYNTAYARNNLVPGKTYILINNNKRKIKNIHIDKTFIRVSLFGRNINPLTFDSEELHIYKN